MQPRLCGFPFLTVPAPPPPTPTPLGYDPTLGEPELRHGPLPRAPGSTRVVGSVAEELAAAQGSSQVGQAGRCSRRRRSRAGGAPQWDGITPSLSFFIFQPGGKCAGGRLLRPTPGLPASFSRVALAGQCWSADCLNHAPPAPGPASPPSPQVVLEGELLNLGVTSPAAALALGLMYLQTNDAAVAAAFQLPGEPGRRDGAAACVHWQGGGRAPLGHLLPAAAGRAGPRCTTCPTASAGLSPPRPHPFPPQTPTLPWTLCSRSS